MKNISRWLGMLAIGIAVQGGIAGLAWAQASPPAVPGAAPSAQPPAGLSLGTGFPTSTQEYNDNPFGPVVTSPSEAESETELPVLFVTGVEILKTQTEPELDIVRVTGLVGAQGWSSPQLVPTYIGKPLDGILDLQFIATMPLQTETATGFVPISAVFPIEQGSAFKGVRVRSSENAIEVDQIPGSKTEKIGLEGCKDCVGKKFAERGQAAPGTPGVIRQEDLPKILRWIPPTRGIRGITHNPNRLNLLLGADNTIIAAYWE